MPKVILFYLSPNNTGGWVTFTAHLIKTLEAVGVEVDLRKIGNNTENKRRPFGYGLTYKNTSPEDAYDLAVHETTLIVAAAKKFKEHTEELLMLGAKIVIHDPTEFKNISPLALTADQVVTIRKTGQTAVNAFLGLDVEFEKPVAFIRHPYVRREIPSAQKDVLVVSTSRIDFDKNSTLLLDANRLLEGEDKIKMYGFENRLYTRFKVCPDYPEWEQSKCAYPREIDAAFNILNDAMFMVDMSVIKGDGGGTQYTFLEAWDAGCIPIIHSEWIIDGDDMEEGINCLVADSGESIAKLINAFDLEPTEDGFIAELVKSGQEALERHDPQVIGNQYREFLDV